MHRFLFMHLFIFCLICIVIQSSVSQKHDSVCSEEGVFSKSIQFVVNHLVMLVAQKVHTFFNVMLMLFFTLLIALIG